MKSSLKVYREPLRRELSIQFQFVFKKRIETTRADKKVLISNQEDLVQSLKIPLQ